MYSMVDDGKLIEEVFNRKCLFDRDDPRYTNKEIVSKSWHDIAKELNSTAEDVRKRWTNLRDYFRRQYKDEGKLGHGSVRRKKWPFYDRMLFLAPFLKQRNASGKLDDSNSSITSDPPQYLSDEDGEDQPEYKFSPRQDFSQSHHNNVAIPSTSMPPVPVSEPIPLKRKQREQERDRKRKREDDFEIQISKAFQEKSDDEDEQFFKSCLPTVRSLGRIDKMEFRLRVQELLLQLVKKSKPCYPESNETEDSFTCPTQTDLSSIQ